MRRRIRALRSGVLRSERGAALVEFALTVPLLLALTAAIIDGGWALHQAGLVTAAAEAAQRAVALQDTGSGDCTGAPPGSYGGLAAAAAAAAAPTLNPGAISVDLRYLEPSCVGRMRTLIVDVTYTFQALTPWLAGLLNGRRLTAEAGSAVEEVPPPWWGSAAQVQSDLAEIQSQQARLASQASQLVSLTSAYQRVLSEYQAASSAYQAEASLASSLSQDAAYYYSLWQQAVNSANAGGGNAEWEHE
jgi:hypothetical protein